MGTHVLMFVPRLSRTMGVLNENDSLAYLTTLEELSSGLSLTMSFFITFGFLLLLMGISGRQKHPV